MPEINANELMNRFRQPGGTDWTGFVNGVLWAACWQAGIAESLLQIRREAAVFTTPTATPL